mmetsp:Transcript_15789/g.19253  ORF Transcript_15789/g.19253 Transcript_15789/m.19253 type:complete len:135 (-) Transcript_15789:76-480(-)
MLVSGRSKGDKRPAFCALTTKTLTAQQACIKCTTCTSLVPFWRKINAYNAPTPIPRAKQFSAQALEITKANQAPSPCVAMFDSISRHSLTETSTKVYELHESNRPPSNCMRPRSATDDTTSANVDTTRGRCTHF